MNAEQAAELVTDIDCEMLGVPTIDRHLIDQRGICGYREPRNQEG